MPTARVTFKGQITIPKEVRESLGILEGDVVVIVRDGDKAILRPVHPRSVSDLRGKLPATRPYPGSEAIRRETGRVLGTRQQV